MKIIKVINIKRPPVISRDEIAKALGAEWLCMYCSQIYRTNFGHAQAHMPCCVSGCGCSCKD
jgi:hypothetical protein